jgi:hypothetical protein
MRNVYRNLAFVAFAILTANTFASQSHAAHEGGSSPGGGDMCEDRIKLIRDDIGAWINKGGPASLKLPAGITVSDYSQRIASAISKAQIECVTQGDQHYPVEVFGRPKVCRFEPSENLITCDFVKFNSTNEVEQYRLIHHELAGLAGLELPDRADSHYGISNQITSFLKNEIVKRLAIVPIAITEDGWETPTQDKAGFIMKHVSTSVKLTKYRNCEVRELDEMFNQSGDNFILGPSTHPEINWVEFYGDIAMYKFSPGESSQKVQLNRRLHAIRVVSEIRTRDRVVTHTIYFDQSNKRIVQVKNEVDRTRVACVHDTVGIGAILESGECKISRPATMTCDAL